MASRACAGALGRALPAGPMWAARWKSCSYRADDLLMKGVEMRNKLKPEGNFVGTVIIPDARLQPDVEVLLVFRAEFGPDNFLEAVGLSMDELGILRYWNVRITGKKILKQIEKKIKRQNCICIQVSLGKQIWTDQTLTLSWQSWSSMSSPQR